MRLRSFITPMPVHMALLMRSDGKVSPLCRFHRPRVIDLSQATWTLRRQDATCPRCRAALDQQDFGLMTGLAS